MADGQGVKKSKTRKVEKIHECPLCSKKFFSLILLEQHMRKRHDGERPHECTVCGKKFAGSGSLVPHMRIHTGEKPYKCPICHKNFRTQPYEHMKIHVGDKCHKCLLCGKGFLAAATLRRHMLSHTGEKAFECPVCTRRFAYKGHLKDHMRTHSPKETHRCSICSRVFTLYEDLSRHMLSHIVPATHIQTRIHNIPEYRKTKDGQIQYTCYTCSRHLDTGTDASITMACCHLDVHKKSTAQLSRNMQLGVCTEQSSEAVDDQEKDNCKVKEHEKTPADRILYECSFCDKQFDTTTSEGMSEACDHLDTHKEADVQPRPSLQQDPGIGDRNDKETVDSGIEFSTQPALEEHKTTHADQIQYACSMCGKQFDTELDACNHMHSHEEEMLQPFSSLQQMSQVKDEDNKEMVTSPALTNVDKKRRLVQDSEVKTSLSNSIRSHRNKSPANATTTDEKDKKAVSGTTVEVADRIVSQRLPVIHLNNGAWAISARPLPQTDSEQPELGTGMMEPNVDTNKETHMMCSIKTELYQCAICEQRFVNLAILKQHMSAMHARENSGNRPDRSKVYHKCHLCNKQFLEAFYLQKHMLLKHNGTLFELTNDNPRAALEQAGRLGRPHLTRQDPHDKSYTCSDCSAHFAEEADLKAHLLTHTGKVSQKYPKLSSLKTHMNTRQSEHNLDASVYVKIEKHEPEPSSHRATDVAPVKDETRTCVFCGEEFESKAGAKKHMMNTAGSCKKKKVVRKCGVCSERFTSLTCLKAHMMTHTGGQLYIKCTVCSKQFTSLTCIKAHMMTHIGGQLYKCTICSKQFTSLTCVKAHMKAHTDV